MINLSLRRIKMKKSLFYTMMAVVLTIVFSPLAYAASEEVATVDYTKAIVIGLSVFAAGFAIALGTIGTGLGMGNGLNGATNAVGRNPEAQGKVLLTMMVGLAMIESLAIYALVVALILLYANPLLKYIGG